MVNLQDSIEFKNNQSVQKMLNGLMGDYLSIALSADCTEDAKRLEALTAHKVLKDFYEKMMGPANKNLT